MYEKVIVKDCEVGIRKYKRYLVWLIVLLALLVALICVSWSVAIVSILLICMSLMAVSMISFVLGKINKHTEIKNRLLTENIVVNDVRVVGVRRSGSGKYFAKVEDMYGNVIADDLEVNVYCFNKFVFSGSLKGTLIKSLYSSEISSGTSYRLII